MDFQSMMNAANKNAQKASNEMSKINTEVNEEKNALKRQLAAEKRLRLEMQKRKAEKAREVEKRKEEERRKSFVIPKKDSSGVNSDALKAYYEKQENEKREKERKAEIERERLMRLRVQANGGKATKKIGKHFGLDPVDLQIRFGGNNEHIETLQKRKIREIEETDLEADKLRTGVFKALQMKRKNEEKLRNTVKGPHRISTSKSNSLAGLCSRHEKTRDTFSPPKNGKQNNEEEKKEPTKKKKIQPAPPVDFKTLMETATCISQGREINKNKLEGSPKPMKKINSKIQPSPNKTKVDKIANRSKASKNVARDDVEKNNAMSMSKPSSSSTKINSLKPVSKENLKNEDDKKKDGKGRFVKGPTPPPDIPSIVPGKKYLPGDIRYQQAIALAKKKGLDMSTASSDSKTNVSNVRKMEEIREKERERLRKLKRERQEKERQEYEKEEKRNRIDRSKSSSTSYKKHYESRREEELRKQQIREKYGRKKYDYGGNSFFRGGDDNSDDEDDERDYDRYDDDDYDSEMDDFIDDTEVDMDNMGRKELEETLRLVNKNYDKKKWSQREKMISEKEMISDFRRIQSEENYSKRAGMLEDLREATKGRSVRL